MNQLNTANKKCPNSRRNIKNLFTKIEELILNACQKLVEDSPMLIKKADVYNKFD